MGAAPADRLTYLEQIAANRGFSSPAPTAKLKTPLSACTDWVTEVAVKLWEATFVMLIGAALAQAQSPPPALTEDQRKAQELLKRTIEERQRNNPQAHTNAHANTNATVLANAPRLTQAEIEREYGPFPEAERVNGVTFDGAQVWFASGDKLQAFDP